MKTSKRKTYLATTRAIMAGFASLMFTPCFAQSDGPAGQPAVAAQAQVSFSPGIRDVLKMLDAKVDPGVIIAYIKNSPIPFNPSASEIIALKQHGVPDDLITALLQHGAEVRAQMAQAAQAGPSMANPNAAGPGYAYDYGATAPNYSYPYDYADYSYGYPYYGYAGYPYSYGWYNYGYPYRYCGYPFGYCSPYFFGFYGYRGGFNHFHGYGSIAYRGGLGYGNRSAPWAATRGYAQRSVAAQNTAFRATGAFSGRQMAFAGVRTGGFAGRVSGYGGHMSGFAAHSGGFGGHGGGFGGHGGGGHR